LTHESLVERSSHRIHTTYPSFPLGKYAVAYRLSGGTPNQPPARRRGLQRCIHLAIAHACSDRLPFNLYWEMDQREG